jgi:hypothetical protein
VFGLFRFLQAKGNSKLFVWRVGFANHDLIARADEMNNYQLITVPSNVLQDDGAFVVLLFLFFLNPPPPQTHYRFFSQPLASLG